VPFAAHYTITAHIDMTRLVRQETGISAALGI